MTSPLGLNPPDSGTIRDNSLNLTRVLALTSGVIALVTTLTSVGQASSATTSDPADIDWAGLTDFRRFVLLLFLLGAVTLMYSIDVVARAVVSSRVDGASVLLLPRPRPARLTSGTADGQAIAIRASDNRILFYDPSSSSVSWVAEDGLNFRTP